MSEFSIPASPSEFPASEKKSRVLNIREDVTKGNPVPKSKSRRRLDSLKTDSSLYQQNEATGMNAIDQANSLKKLREQYEQAQSTKAMSTGGRKRRSRKRRTKRRTQRRAKKSVKRRRRKSHRRRR